MREEEDFSTKPTTWYDLRGEVVIIDDSGDSGITYGIFPKREYAEEYQRVLAERGIRTRIIEMQFDYYSIA